MNKVKDVMTTKVEFIEPERTIVDAAVLMKKIGTGALPVGQGERLIGMITDRDIVLRSVAEGKDPLIATVEECMTPKVLYCYEDDSIEELSNNFAANQVQRFPVVDKDKNLVGIVSVGDIARESTAEEELELTGGAMHEIKRAA